MKSTAPHQKRSSLLKSHGILYSVFSITVARCPWYPTWNQDLVWKKRDYYRLIITCFSPWLIYSWRCNILFSAWQNTLALETLLPWLRSGKSSFYFEIMFHRLHQSAWCSPKLTIGCSFPFVFDFLIFNKTFWLKKGDYFVWMSHEPRALFHWAQFCQLIKACTARADQCCCLNIDHS